MSQTETHAGKLRKVQLVENQTVDQFCERTLKIAGINTLGTTSEQIIESFTELFSYKYVLGNNSIWEIYDHEETDENEIIKFIHHDNGEISFVAQFDNGDTYLQELLEYELKNYEATVLV